MNQQTIIIGGGIIGLSIAVTLVKKILVDNVSKNTSITLLDASEVGMGASFGNAGHIATEQVYPVADPSILKKLPAMLIDPLGPLRIDWRYIPKLTPWAWKMALNMLPTRFQQNHLALLNLNAYCLQDWKEFAKEWNLQQWFKVHGSLLSCEREETKQALQKHGKHLNQLGVENQWLSASELHEYEPTLASNQCGALFYPKTGHITDLAGVCKKLADEFQKLGGKIKTNCKVNSGNINTAGEIDLQTNSGKIKANKVIIAAGAHSKELVKQLTKITVPLDTERGYHLMLPEEHKCLRIPVSSADRRFIMTPMDNGLRLAGTVEYAGLQAPPNMERARKLLPLAQGMLAKPLQTNNSREWMGFRPTTADSLPVIDRCGNVLLAFGHQHLGLTQAVTTAKAIEALYFNKAWPYDLLPFRLHRFI